MSKEGSRYWRILELSFDGLGYFWPRYGEYSPQITCLLTCLTCFCFSMKTQHVCQGMFVDVKVPSCWLCLLFFFRKEQGSSAYLIEVGGSSYMGMFGYLTAFQEMIDQVKLQAFSVLCAHFVHFWSRGDECS